MKHGQGKEHSPTEFQNLVGSDTGECKASPNEDDEEHQPRFDQCHNGAWNQEIGFTDDGKGPNGALERKVPSTEEKVSEEETSSICADVFGHEEHAKPHASVLRPPAFNQFGFGFGHVKGNSLNFGDHRDQEQCSTKRHEEDVPSACRVLEVNAVDDVECPGENGHREQRQEEWNFIRRQLSGRTNTADEGVFVVGRPSGEEHTDGSNAEDGNGVENGEVWIGCVDAARERNHAQNEQR